MHADSSPKISEQNIRGTYRYDLWREGFSGILESGWITFGVLIALRYFEASEWVKASIAASAFVGMTMTPLTLYISSKLRCGAEKICAFYYIACGLSLSLAAWIPDLSIYAWGMMIAHFMYAQRIPLITHIYSYHYPKSERGQRVSTAFIMLSISGLIFAYAGGELLDIKLSYYSALLQCMGLASLAAAWAAYKLPHTSTHTTKAIRPWESMQLLWQDRLFGWMVLSWALVGGTMLMTIPLRAEYLANPDYGINASNRIVAIITYVIPSLAYILSLKYWGRLYDILPFIPLRASINIFFVVGMLLYFIPQNLLIISIGAALIGLGMGGGRISWNLWVTQVAPHEKVSSYMSAHTSIAGLRGMLVPFAGYFLLTHLGPDALGILCSAMIALSALMFYAARKHSRFQG